ncbi:MAG: hypothetical protein Q8P49_02535, partial [Candidatus Liptonbacteria bacterium]|nr:hypothetical protein [Candidatus Liptonbacteria bacterium]
MADFSGGRDRIDDELNEAFRKEGTSAIRDEIESNELRLAEVRNTMKVLEFFAGNGLADGMPLGEALGFLDAELKKKEPEMDEDEIQRARDFLLGIIGKEYPAEMQLGALMEKLVEEE